MPEGVRVSDVVSVGGYADTPASNYWEGASAAPVGSTSMTRIVVVSMSRFRLAATQTIWGNDNAAARGWRWLADNSGVDMTWRLANGAGVVQDVSVSPAWRDNRLLVCVGSYDGTTSRMQVNAQVGTPLATGGGYTAGVRNMTVGIEPLNYAQPAVPFGAALLMSTDLVALSAANIATAVTQITQDMENGRDPSTRVEALLGGTPADYTYWNAEDAIDGSGKVKPTWVPRVGANTLTKTGNLQAFSTQARLM